MNKKILIGLIIGILIIGGLFYLLGKKQGTPTNPNKLAVTTSFYPLYFFASQIGGDKVDVKNITPAGAEPHDYEPSTQDLAKIEKSKMLILNGGVESWADKVRDNLKDKNVEIIIAGDGLITKDLNEDGKTIKDPHIWLSPILAKKEVKKITEGFIKIDPANSSFYEANVSNLETKLDALDKKFREGLANCQSKDIITSHAAFGYLASEYNLKQVSIAGLSPDEEPSSKQLAEVAKYAKENNIKYIFFESLVSPKLSDTIAQEIGAKTLVLDPIEGISNDKVNAGADYFSVMNQNLENIKIALKCS